jgi:hypothetical protein
MVFCDFLVNDVVFVLDPSATIGASEFAQMLQFAADVVGELTIGRENVR